MENKFNISDDFIPEGLEFREEYMEKALSMYGAQKRIIFLRKVYVAAAASVVVATTSWFVFSSKVDHQPEMAEEQKIENSHEQMTGTDHTVADTDTKNDNTTAATDVTPGESNIDNRGLKPVERKENNKQATYNPQGQRHQSQQTFDHGDPMSSGVGSPDLESSVKNNSQEKKEDQKLVSSPSSPEQMKEAAPDENVAATPLENSQPINNVTGEDIPVTAEETSAAEKEEVVEPAFAIAYLDGSFMLTGAELEKAKAIEAEKWKRLHAYAGIGAVPLSNFGASTKGLQPDPMVMAGVDYQMHHGLTLGFEAKYFSISGLSHPYEVENTTYGQGYTTTTTTFYTNKLHYAGVSPVIRKTFRGQHQLSLGYALDYLVTGNNSVASARQGSYENTDLGSHESKGYVAGFSDINQSVSLGYTYWLGKNKALGANYYFGLTDISRNQYFTTSTFDRNSMLSVYFKMNLF